MSNIQVSSTFLLLLTPISLAYRDGALSESCYGHEIVHVSGNPMVPPTFKQVCLSPCSYDLTLNGRFDDATGAITITDALQCGEVYQCKYKFNWSGS